MHSFFSSLPLIASLVVAALFCVAAATYVRAARSDFNGMTIPNSLSLTLLGIYAALHTAIAVFTGHVAVATILGHLLVGGIVFVVLLGLYALHMIGGGDTKLIAASILLVGGQDAGRFLLLMILCGGVLALLGRYWQKHPERIPARFGPPTWPDHLRQGKNGVPYGIAIAAGALITLIFQWGGLITRHLCPALTL